MLAVDDIFAEERLEGRLEGKLEGRLETAQNLIRSGISYEKIAAATGLKEEDLRKQLAGENISGPQPQRRYGSAVMDNLMNQSLPAASQQQESRSCVKPGNKPEV